MGALTGRGVARGGLLFALLLAAVVRLPHLRFVPIWDGRTYWDDCLQPALLGPFEPLAFNCFGHRSMLYMLAISWPQYFDHGSVVLLNLALLAVSLLAVYALHRITTAVFPPGAEPRTGMDAALLTILFAAMPIWTASSLNLNPDVGVMTGFLFGLFLLLEGRRNRAVAAGIFMALSKQIGLLLWLAMAGLETLLAVSARGLHRTERARRLAARWPSSIPVIIYFAVAKLLQARALPEQWPKAGDSTMALVRTFVTFDPTAFHYREYMADIFILNFAWVMTVVVIIWLVAVVAAVLRDRGVPLADRLDRRRTLLFVLVWAAAVYLLTRYPTFNNPRYLLPAFALLVVGFGVAAATVIPRATTRAAVLLLAAALQLASMWHTVDPLSRGIYGTFDFGRHPMLKMTSMSGECCGHGRDQLVYNLQFTQFHYIQDALFRTLRPDQDDAFLVSRYTPWYLHGQLDAVTRTRTLRTDNVIRPRFLSLDDLRAGAPFPERATYLSFPNIQDAHERRVLSRYYEARGPVLFDNHGYRIAVFDLRLRAERK